MNKHFTSDNIDSVASPIMENYLGALDIGSNSFHFVFARVVDENVQILHSQKYQVKLANGLNSNNELDQPAIDRALETLADIAPLTEKLNSSNFRVVATYTLRQATNTHTLLDAAAKIFPFDIEVISGHEEARLIYQGVAHHCEPDIKRLVVDIGGGSTECVVGKNFSTRYLTSLNIGCVSFFERYFSDGKISHVAFDSAIMDARLEIESHVKRFKKSGWQEVLGTSGTMKAICRIIQEQFNSKSVTLDHLHLLKDELVKFGHINAIPYSSIKESRKSILAPGLAILIGICEMLKIRSLSYCDYALREGVLYEQLNLLNYDDIRDRTVNSLFTRFNIDTEQAQNVATLAQAMIKQVDKSWKITSPIYHKLVTWGATLHEIGFDINPSAYHKHGLYILMNADLPGFTIEQQYALAFLVGHQRKKLQSIEKHHLYLLKVKAIEKCVVILRLAILLQQQRQLNDIPSFSLTVNNLSLHLSFSAPFLDNNPLIKSDLTIEKGHLKAFDIKLVIEE